jgi:CBS domain containing-hemolysin-like protein
MLVLFIAIGIVLLSSAICSGSEAALFSVRIVKVRRLAQSKRPEALALLSIREQMNRPIATIVILNNIANIVGTSVVTVLASDVLGSRWLGLVSGILTFLVILFSEIIPKTLGERYSDQIALVIARPVSGLTRILTPLVWCIEKVTTPLTAGGNSFTTDEAEIQLLAKMGQEAGTIEDDEFEMIRKIFNLNDMMAADLMTPRVVMTYLKGDLTLAEAKADILTSPHSRIIIIGETLDQVIGVALKTELLAGIIQGKLDQSISNFAYTVQFVLGRKRADQLLSIFQQTRQHLAVVVDEYGGVSGVVTLEDVLEVLTGQLVDETDTIDDLQEFARKRKN